MITAQWMTVAQWIAAQLLAGKTVQHCSGLKAYPRLSSGVLSYGVTTANGLKHTFACASAAAGFASLAR